MARTPATSRRAAPTKVSKPFPWGTAAGSAVLALALGGILFYAATNQGAGRDQLQTNPDAAIEGVAVAEGEVARGHVSGPVDYPQTPPNSGDHNIEPQQCAVYTAPIPPEHAVHSLEHGAVWITYNDDVPDDQVEELTSKAEGETYALLSPLPEQKSPINLSAWGRRLSVDSADDGRIDDFIRGYANGPQAPEPGAACIGNTSTGAVAPAPPAAPAPATSPGASVEVPIEPAPVPPAPAEETPAS